MRVAFLGLGIMGRPMAANLVKAGHERSEEHTSELQSQSNLVCRLLLEKKKPSHISAVRDRGRDYERASHQQYGSLSAKSQINSQVVLEIDPVAPIIGL